MQEAVLGAQHNALDESLEERQYSVQMEEDGKQLSHLHSSATSPQQDSSKAHSYREKALEENVSFLTRGGADVFRFTGQLPCEAKLVITGNQVLGESCAELKATAAIIDSLGTALKCSRKKFASLKAVTSKHAE